MSYLNFDKSELVNLEYSLPREVLLTNRTGGYCNTTIVGCNTRKYHGLFVLPVDKYQGRRYVLLSSMDETLIQHGKEFNLGIRCYGKNIYEPRGHKYIVDLDFDRACALTYRVGGMLFRKSVLFLHNREQLLVKYELLEAHSPTVLRLRPFLAYREIHALTRSNPEADTGYVPVENGASFRMYKDFPELKIQLNRKCGYVHRPLWYYGVVYQEEQRRGFDYREDLYAPGYFELPIEKGVPVVLSVSTSEVAARGLTRVFNDNIRMRPLRDSYLNCLKHAAGQFIVSSNGLKEVYSGYTWLGKGLRETLIALPGITLFKDGDVRTFEEVMSSLFKTYRRQIYNGSRQADAALWMFWAVQQYVRYTGDPEGAWRKFGSKLKGIARSFADGGRMGVTLQENGLLYAKMQGVAMTWMNAYDDNGVPITERGGCQIEVNALWYNALRYLIDNGSAYGDDAASLERWRRIAGFVEECFSRTFWCEERGHLADYVDQSGRNIFSRPNQVIACSLDYSPLTEEQKASVMDHVKRELLTIRGLRTLSPKNPLYKGIYDGNQHQRDLAYHQGSTRVWLLPFYIETCLKLYGDLFLKKAWTLVNAFEEDMTVHGVGSICELYDGDPPHNPHGAISSSVAVGGLLRAVYLMENYKNNGQ